MGPTLADIREARDASRFALAPRKPRPRRRGYARPTWPAARIRRLGRRRAVVLATVCSLAAHSVAATTAGALNRAQADAAALRALAPQKLAGMVTLFGEPAPLARGQTVSAWSLLPRRAAL